MSIKDRSFERIPEYRPLFARGTVGDDPVTVVGYEFIPGAWGKEQRGLTKVRYADGTIRAIPAANFCRPALEDREVIEGFGLEQIAFLRSRSEAPTIAAARTLLAPVAGHSLFETALELMACPIVAWSKAFPDMPMTWSIHAREEGEEDERPTVYMQLRLDSVGSKTGHKALLLVWVEAKTDGWTLAENAPGVRAIPYVGDLTTLDSALACLVDGSHG